MSMAEAALLFPPDQILQFIGGQRDTDGPPLERAFMERFESDFGAEHRRNAFHTPPTAAAATIRASAICRRSSSSRFLSRA